MDKEQTFETANRLVNAVGEMFAILPDEAFAAALREPPSPDYYDNGFFYLLFCRMPEARRQLVIDHVVVADEVREVMRAFQALRRRELEVFGFTLGPRQSPTPDAETPGRPPLPKGGSGTAPPKGGAK